MTLRVYHVLLLALAFALGMWLAAVALFVVRAHAAEQAYTSADVLAAIEQYSAEQGVSAAYLEAVIRCEDPSLDPYAVGRQGELGPVQLHPRGELLRFYAWHYTDPFSPWQSVRFLAQEVNFGRASQWSCAR